MKESQLHVSSFDFNELNINLNFERSPDKPYLKNLNRMGSKPRLENPIDDRDFN